MVRVRVGVRARVRVRIRARVRVGCRVRWASLSTSWWKKPTGASSFSLP